MQQLKKKLIINYAITRLTTATITRLTMLTVMVRCEISNKLPIALMMFRKTLQFVFSVIFK